jgi:hypothetical protein
MIYYFYLTKHDLNDATSYYLDIIRNAIKQDKANEVIVVDSWKKLNKDSYVFVINLKTFYMAYRLTGCRKLVMWFQGIYPEELRLSAPGKHTYIKILIYNLIEKLVLKKSLFLFFVSEAMRLHYEKKWEYTGSNYTIMPCFNKAIRKEAFYYPDKYKRMSFVYAGNLSSWQCIDETLDLYKKIEEYFVNTQLIFLTKDKDKALKLTQEKGIATAHIDYIPLESLDDELQKYKYAFLIRKDIPINQVATPTKMNTYLANGLIPIYSNVVSAFRGKVENLDPVITINAGMTLKDIIRVIQTIEERGIELDSIYEEYEKLFDDFYNKNKYAEVIASIFKKQS